MGPSARGFSPTRTGAKIQPALSRFFLPAARASFIPVGSRPPFASRSALSSANIPNNTGSSPPGPPARPTFGSRLAELQAKRPAIPLVIAGVITLIAAALALRLHVLTGFESLLPESRPSVQELNRVAERTAGVSTFFVVLQGAPDTPTPALRKAADALVPEIATIGPPWVGSVESGVHDALRFLGPRAGLFVDKEKLEKLRDDVNARFEYEVSKATGALLDDSDPPPEINEASLRESFGLKDVDTGRYPDGYYQSQDGKTVVVALRSKVLGSDFTNGSEAIRRISEVVTRVNPASFHAGIRYGFAGDLQTGIAEYTAINNDLTEVGFTGAILITAVVFAYYLRFRTLLTMMLTVGIGVAWTFGVTQLVIGNLNMATGFLFTIIAGNGINFGIIYMARYLEGRRNGEDMATALRTAQVETWLPTLTAGLAASAAYGSLGVTEFRGFRDFGLIGGVGMILCWLATFWTLPAILSVIERIAPLDRESKGPIARLRRLTQGGVAFGTPFAALAPKAPRAIVVIGVALAVIGSAITVQYVRADPMEYDLKNLRTDPSARAEQIRLTQLAEGITGHVGADGMAILVDRPEQVDPLRTALYAKRDAAPADAKPFKEVFALQDFVPKDQEAKIPILLEIKDKVVRARKRDVINDKDWDKIKEVLPPDDLKPFGIADLPDDVARAFTETDGTRGRIVYISPITPESVDDARYLFRWADSYRETKLPDGSVIRGSGRAVIYADMWAAVISDVPPSIIASFAATLLVVLVAFRAGRASMAVLLALIIGIAWMTGVLVLLRVKLNFLNFIALPLTFGIGVDYAVNIVQRFVREGAGGALKAVRETGGAVILCSLTTTLGYLALVGSENFAVRSMGVAAVIGEVACLLAAVLILPAGLLWIDGRSGKDGKDGKERVSVLR